MILARVLRFALAAVVCSISLILPYRLRVVYGQAVAFIAHLPFIVFGRLARFMLREFEVGKI